MAGFCFAGGGGCMAGCWSRHVEGLAARQCGDCSRLVSFGRGDWDVTDDDEGGKRRTKGCEAHGSRAENGMRLAAVSAAAALNCFWESRHTAGSWCLVSQRQLGVSNSRSRV